MTVPAAAGTDREARAARDDVSVVICSYNGARFIDAQIASILAQSVLPGEIVLVDDASTDATFAQGERALTAAAVPLRLLRQPRNVGYVANFQFALAQARGDIVFLCDQDDVWFPHKIETMLACLDADADVVLAYSDAVLADEALAPLPGTLFDALGLSQEERAATTSEALFGVLLRRNIVTGACTAVRRRLIVAAGSVEPGFAHDEWLALIACTVGRVRRLDQPLLAYRQHGGNQIGVPTSMAARLKRFLDPGRSDRHAAAARLRRLRARLEAQRSAGAGRVDLESMLSELAASSAFAETRSAMPAPRLLRAVSVGRGLAGGGYARYARGLKTAVRDLIDPT